MYRLADSAEAWSGFWIWVKVGSVSGKALRRSVCRRVFLWFCGLRLGRCGLLKEPVEAVGREWGRMSDRTVFTPERNSTGIHVQPAVIWSGDTGWPGYSMRRSA